jgi:hypothetical protein
MRINLGLGELFTYILPSAGVAVVVWQYAAAPALKGFMGVDAVMTNKDLIPALSYEIGEKTGIVFKAFFVGEEDPEIIRKTPSDTQN